MIVILDLDYGNSNAIKNALIKLKAECIISNEHKDIDRADKIIIPGVGKFDNFMNNLSKFKLEKLLYKKVLINKNPILGICVGMQIMTDKSEEGERNGLSWISGCTKKFNKDHQLKIPHIGWNNLEKKNNNDIFNNINLDNSKFYFCHSYYVKISDNSHSLSKTSYGSSFDSVIKKDNIYGCQFHPEKSYKQGLNFLYNFIRL